MQFIAENFHKCSDTLSYNAGTPTAPNYKFVARFKYQRSAANDFKKFLMKNFTVDEYFTRLDAGETPVAILESKGYVLPHIRKQLKQDGYEVTPAGFRQYIRDKIKAREAKEAV